jgi:amino acid adenylation domain-containing protein
MTNELLTTFVGTLNKFGDRNAFCINEQFYSYTELAQSVSKIRKTLQESTIESQNIGLVANDDIETYASIYAILMEGLAYVPLNPMQPNERNLEIIAQTEIEIILSSNKISFPNVKIIETNNLIFEDYILEPKEVDNSTLFCIFFTSGSTGIPKGVTVTYENVNAIVQSFWDAGYIVDENDKFLQAVDLTFTVSLLTYFVPTLIGSCVYTIPRNQPPHSSMAELMEEHSLTFAFMVPSTIRSLKPYFDEISFPSLRYNIFAGEPLHLVLAQQWSKCIPNSSIDYFWGSTEASGICIVYHFVRNGYNKSHNGILSIGRPMEGNEIIIVDDVNQPVANNIQGVISIATRKLTPGYLKDTNRNKEVFFIHNNTRFYRTGDIGYKDEDGDIFFCGRYDFQIKIHGIRIELGEIEYHARKFFVEQNVVCVPFENKTGNTEIALFVESPECDSQMLTEYLQSKLPTYMIPKTIINCDKFPLNINGKIDKSALKNII